MLTCQQLTELVTDYLEGRMSLMERISFRLHVGMCRHCHAYLRQMKKVARATGQVPEIVIPSNVERELLERFRS